jgi:hypothetical protein
MQILRKSSIFIGTAILFFALPVLVFAEGLFLTNKNGDRTTQFALTDEVYVEGFCLPTANLTVKVYITNDDTWKAGDSLYDVSGGMELVTVAGESMLPRTKIWGMPYSGSFDVVIDVNNDLLLQEFETSCVIGANSTGFTIGNTQPVATPTPILVITPAPTPMPTSTPVPIATTVSSKPSENLKLDSYVEVKNLSNIRSTPGGPLLGTQYKGTVGVVVGGPIRENVGGLDYWFWNINFEDDPDGWVAESTIKSISQPIIVEPEKIIEPTIQELPKKTDENIVIVEPEAAVLNQIDSEKSLAQASDDGATESLMGAFIVGLSILFGFISGSYIIAKALRKS